MTYLNLFIAFFRSGILGYGGGPSSIPLVHKEVVGNFKWMNDEEFGDVLALGNALPGPINTKMAGYIGYRVAGILGMLVAILSSILPTIILMIVLLTSLAQYKDQPWVQGMTKGVLPVVAVMMGVLTWQFFSSSKKGLGIKLSLIHIVVGVILLQVLGVHPAFLIGALLAYALLKPEKKKQEEPVEEAKRGEGLG
ncbi:chromate transporter [Fictibacillus enclensis]|uniref:chromate transporter n=1 Tax=Fictibacillus enclensis TaxID=1017270 RepID=UPI0024C03597|nr:chromate transporter [Fictibacillus enclensis]MDM5339866.1 chromate transporter [Fictibacillus enclensis]WHY71404.1 chromate transporter [Fictibacillus enclensis]